jgi:uncharacterized protein (DUF305 family)
MFATNQGVNMKISKIALATFAAIALSANAAPQHQGGSHGAGLDMANMQSIHKSSPNASKAPYEQQFLDTMAMHHQMAMHMAGLVESRSASQELKDMAKTMMAEQEKEIAQLKGWKEQWYAGKPEAMNMKMPGMPESMKGMSGDKLMSAKGEQFDRMFVDMMSQHHKGAIKMAQTAGPKLQHAEVKEFANKLVDMQKKEVAHMAEMKKSWAAPKK